MELLRLIIESTHTDVSTAETWSANQINEECDIICQNQNPADVLVIYIENKCVAQ